MSTALTQTSADANSSVLIADMRFLSHRGQARAAGQQPTQHQGGEACMPGPGEQPQRWAWITGAKTSLRGASRPAKPAQQAPTAQQQPQRVEKALARLAAMLKKRVKVKGW